MNLKISNLQLASLLTISAMVSETTCSPYSYNYSMEWLSYGITMAISVLLLYIPLMIASAKLKAGPFEIIAGKSRAAGFIFGLVLILRLLYGAIRMTSEMEFYVTNTIMPYFSFIALLVTVYAVAMYALAKGIQAAARVAPVIIIAFIVLIVTFTVSNRDKVHFVNLYSPFAEGIFKFDRGFLGDLLKKDEFFMFAVLCGLTREREKETGKSYKSVLMYIPFVLTVMLYLYGMYVVILGRYLNRTIYPFYTIAAFTDTTAICADVALGIIAGTLKLSLIFICIGMVAGSIIKKEDPAEKGVSAGKLVTAVLALGIAIVSPRFIVFYSSVIAYAFPYLIAAMAIIVIALPITALIIPKGGKANREIPKNADAV